MLLLLVLFFLLLVEPVGGVEGERQGHYLEWYELKTVIGFLLP